MLSREHGGSDCGARGERTGGAGLVGKRDDASDVWLEASCRHVGVADPRCFATSITKRVSDPGGNLQLLPGFKASPLPSDKELDSSLQDLELLPLTVGMEMRRRIRRAIGQYELHHQGVSAWVRRPDEEAKLRPIGQSQEIFGHSPDVTVIEPATSFTWRRGVGVANSK